MSDLWRSGVKVAGKTAVMRIADRDCIIQLDGCRFDPCPFFLSLRFHVFRLICPSRARSTFVVHFSYSVRFRDLEHWTLSDWELLLAWLVDSIDRFHGRGQRSFGFTRSVGQDIFSLIHIICIKHSHLVLRNRTSCALTTYSHWTRQGFFIQSFSYAILLEWILDPHIFDELQYQDKDLKAWDSFVGVC